MVVVIHHRTQCGKTPLVIEAAFLMREQPSQRRRPVEVSGRPVRLEIVNVYFFRRVNVESGLGEQRRNVATRTSGFTTEQRRPAASGKVERIIRVGRPRAQGWKLIEVESGELGRDQIRMIPHVAESGFPATGNCPESFNRGSK